MNLDMNSYMIFLFITCRIGGLIFFNPIFGRRNIPAIVKVGLSLGIAISLAPGNSNLQVLDYTSLELIYVMTKEFAVGYALGFITQLFMALFNIGGEIIDLQMGLGMATMYDPTSNSQISINGKQITIMYTLLFFITNSHIALLKIAAKSFSVVPIGMTAINGKIGLYIMELFGYILLYAVQLALPIIVTQIMVEVAVGIMMKVVPNVNVFVINLQLKLIIGTIVILTIIPSLVDFLGKVNLIMLFRAKEILTFFS
ncbi:MAG: flagellar biosynthetic protein FliR [Eubacteriales bacterium]